MLNDPQIRGFMISVALILIGGVISFIAAWFWYQKNARVKAADNIASEKKQGEERRSKERIEAAEKLAKANEELLKRVQDLEKANEVLAQAVLPLSGAFQAMLIKKLTHYHTPVLDALLQKIGPPITLTEDEEKEMFKLLKQRTKDLDGRIDQMERDAASILPVVMRMVKEEIAAQTTLQVVTVPAGTPEQNASDGEKKEEG